jgi:SnoaL-like polyketide cyclase
MSDKGDLFRRFGEIWETGKVDVLDKLLPADIAYHLPPFPDMDREALKQFILGFHQAFPDFELTIQEEIVEREASAHRWSCRGTFSGESPLLPSAPTGRQTEATGTHITHWRDGRPVEMWHNGDWLGWLQMAGVVPPFS